MPSFQPHLLLAISQMDRFKDGVNGWRQEVDEKLLQHVAMVIPSHW